MKELFRERDFSRVGYCQSILAAEGIETIVRNEHLTGLTEFPIPDFFPALCVVNDEEHARAIAILRDHLTADASAADEEIVCATCGETNPGNFEVCWKCGGSVR